MFWKIGNISEDVLCNILQRNSCWDEICNTLSSENERSPKIKCFYCSILSNQFDIDSVIPDISSRINYHMFHTFFMPQQLHCTVLFFQTKGSIRKVPQNVFWKSHGTKTVRCFTPQIVVVPWVSRPIPCLVLKE